MIYRLTLVVAVVAAGLVGDVVGARDFRPFQMTIEWWRADAIGLSDGRTLPRSEVYRLEYWDRANWTQIRIDDPGHPERYVEGRRCRRGQYYYHDERAGWTWASDDPGFCSGVDRWIHWGIAWHYPWARSNGPGPGQITYEDPGERIIFDARSGLPLLYEAGLGSGSAKERIVYRLERYLRG